MMIKLYGLRMSNYYSLTKAVLIEKGLDFEEVKAPPTQKEDNLARTPMGKMPSIGVDGHYLSESFAIVNYLERIQPEPALLPEDPLQAAKALELAYHIKLDVELVARRCISELVFNIPVSDEVKAATEKDLVRGLQAVGQLLVCSPYAAGETFTIADMYVNYGFGLTQAFGAQIANKDLLADYPQITELLARIADRPSIKRVTEEAAA
jgi:glutathione S-transferase